MFISVSLLGDLYGDRNELGDRDWLLYNDEGMYREAF